MSNAVNPFAGLNAAKVFESGEWFEKGKFLLEIKKVIFKAETYQSGPMILVETTVIESDNPAVKVGAERTWGQKLNPPTISQPAIKGFVNAVCGFENDAAATAAGLDQSSVMGAAITDAQPMKGARVVAIFREKMTKGTPAKPSHLITVPNFYPAPKAG